MKDITRKFILPVAIVLYMLAYAGVLCEAGVPDNIGETSQWEIGYWMWSMSESPYANPVGVKSPDLLYVAVGEYRHSGKGQPKGNLHMNRPAKVPRAVRYVAVIRVEGIATPAIFVIPELIEEYITAKKQEELAGRQLIGLQIDFDCPTGKLREYAIFLENLRLALPKEDTLSITALLDWFSPGSRIAEVLQRVDEYVPQFYDVFVRGEKSRDSGIAMPVDPAKWAPIFNSYKRPYHIGISSFGRIANIEADCKGDIRDESSQRTIKEEYYRYSSLSELMRYSKYKKIGEKKTRAAEKLLFFRRTDTPNCKQTLKVTIPTKESVRASYTAARSMGGFCKGVVFYRWPSKAESMALTPEVIERAISNDKRAAGPDIEAKDGYCALVSCMDLYVRLSERFQEKPVWLKISSSTDLEYFIPAEFMNGKQAGPRTIEVRIPAYEGRTGTYVGRVVTAGPSEFSVEEAR